MRNYGIKAQDILVMLKLIVKPGASQKELANDLQISQAEISHGIKRLKLAHLLTENGKVHKEAAIEFLVHGLKYICPVDLGPHAVGIPTSFAKPGFKYVRYNEAYVWPHAEGKIRGASIEPFYPTLPDACLHDEKLYTLASLIEMIRAGRARERNIAAEEIKNFIESTVG